VLLVSDQLAPLAYGFVSMHEFVGVTFVRFWGILVDEEQDASH